MNIPDNYDLWERYDREAAKWRSKLPSCQRCGGEIMQETAVCIEGRWYCDDCLDNYRKEVFEG